MIFNSGGAIDYNAMISNTANENNPFKSTTIGNEVAAGLDPLSDYVSTGGVYTVQPKANDLGFFGSVIDLAKQGLTIWQQTKDQVAPLISTVKPQVINAAPAISFTPAAAAAAQTQIPNGSNTTIVLPNSTPAGQQPQGTQQAGQVFNIDPTMIVIIVVIFIIIMLVRRR